MLRIRAFFHDHPTLASFLLLAPVMVAVLLLAVRDVALEPSQRLWIVAATIGLAALSAWIISWA